VVRTTRAAVTVGYNSAMATVRAHAPGRVNLVGDHTDHTGGRVLPMALDLGTTVAGELGGDRVDLTSEVEPSPARIPLSVTEPAAIEPPWARYVGGVVAELAPTTGLTGTVSTTLPVGAGLSSSAALEVAVALALGADPGDRTGLARLCQRAEQRASGVPCGIMDQLASVAGVEGSALRIDCTTLDIDAVPVPEGWEVVVAHSGAGRRLAGSGYAERVASCQAAEAEIGPLRSAAPGDEIAIADSTLRRRARHVLTENARVDAAVVALRDADGVALGEVLAASHASLRDDFEVSTPALDALVARLDAMPGSFGARLTGAGFGGCAVAVVELGAPVPSDIDHWRVRPAAGARLLP
jgi:galactokinase